MKRLIEVAKEANNAMKSLKCALDLAEKLKN